MTPIVLPFNARIKYIFPPSQKVMDEINAAKQLDLDARLHGQRIDLDYNLVQLQRRHHRENIIEASFYTSFNGFRVRDMHNDGLGIMSPMDLRANQLLVWAENWYKEDPENRCVSIGFIVGSFKEEFEKALAEFNPS